MMILAARGKRMAWPRPPVIMGIVNLGADSFSGDGILETAAAVERARALVAAGAEIIDIGAESARTNRGVMSVDEEAEPLERFVEAWRGEATLLSINTWRPEVARRVLAGGGDLLNDLGGLPTPENAEICAGTGAALLIMHSVGAPKVAHTHVTYADVMAELRRFFAEKIASAEAAGVAREAIVLDPGIDFAKGRAENLRIFRELAQLGEFGRPILLPISRKTVIGEVLGIADPRDRDAGTVACLVAGMLRGAAIFRVHEVRAAAQAARVIAATLAFTGDGGNARGGDDF